VCQRSNPRGGLSWRRRFLSALGLASVLSVTVLTVGQTPGLAHCTATNIKGGIQVTDGSNPVRGNRADICVNNFDMPSGTIGPTL
jgi:hypothetical protein